MERHTSKFSIDSILKSPPRRVACSSWSYDDCKSILSPLCATSPHPHQLSTTPASPVALCFPQHFYTAMALAGTIAAGGFGVPVTSSVYCLQPLPASNSYCSDPQLDTSNADINSDGNSECSSDTASIDEAANSKDSRKSSLTSNSRSYPSRQYLHRTTLNSSAKFSQKRSSGLRLLNNSSRIWRHGSANRNISRDAIAVL